MTMLPVALVALLLSSVSCVLRDDNCAEFGPPSDDGCRQCKPGYLFIRKRCSSEKLGVLVNSMTMKHVASAEEQSRGYPEDRRVFKFVIPKSTDRQTFVDASVLCQSHGLKMYDPRSSDEINTILSRYMYKNYIPSYEGPSEPELKNCQWILSDKPTKYPDLWNNFKSQAAQGVESDKRYGIGTDMWVEDAFGLELNTESHGYKSKDQEHGFLLSAIRKTGNKKATNQGTDCSNNAFGDPQNADWRQCMGSFKDQDKSHECNPKLYTQSHFYVLCETSADCVSKSFPLLANGLSTDLCRDAYKSGETCEFSCKTGYTSTGAATCVDGSWGNPSCMADCAAVTLTGSNVGQCEKAAHGGICEFSCSSGYDVEGNGVCANGEWKLLVTQTKMTTQLNQNLCSPACAKNCGKCNKDDSCIECKAAVFDGSFEKRDNRCFLTCNEGFSIRETDSDHGSYCEKN